MPYSIGLFPSGKIIKRGFPEKNKSMERGIRPSTDNVDAFAGNFGLPSSDFGLFSTIFARNTTH